MVQQVTVLLQYTNINTPRRLNKWRLVIDYIVSDSRSIGTALREPQLRDWSLITGRGGGGLQNGKITAPKLFAPLPSRQVKLFVPPPFKEWKLFTPPLQYG